jgi:ABC-type Fe3+/spermidine/putrescine transport system ATPase subunit
MALLELSGVTMRFGGLIAVNDVSFQVEPGQLYGLIGPNGAGKTTVFNVITGVYKPTQGVIRLDGESIGGKRTGRITRHGVARTFQNIRLFSDMTVARKREGRLPLPAGRPPRAAMLRTKTHAEERNASTGEPRALEDLPPRPPRRGEGAKSAVRQPAPASRSPAPWRLPRDSSSGRARRRDEPQEANELMDLIRWIRTSTGWRSFSSSTT